MTEWAPSPLWSLYRVPRDPDKVGLYFFHPGARRYFGQLAWRCLQFFKVNRCKPINEPITAPLGEVKGQAVSRPRHRGDQRLRRRGYQVEAP